MAGGGSTQRGRPNRYELYEQAVQCPEFEVDFCDTAYREEYGATPLTLREDFCGTAAIAAEWVRSHEHRRAVGVDLDPEPLALCGDLRLPAMEPSERTRLTLQLADVLQVNTDDCDVVIAVNFSWFAMHTREALERYFRGVRRTLGARGLFVLDMMGGPACEQEGHTTQKRIDDEAVYVWEHTTFDPMSRRTTCAIHFEVGEDRESLRNAFTYDWRLWTMPDVCESLIACGFSRVDIHMEIIDQETGCGTGYYRKSERAEALDSFTAYMVAVA